MWLISNSKANSDLNKIGFRLKQKAAGGARNVTVGPVIHCVVDDISTVTLENSNTESTDLRSPHIFNGTTVVEGL
jgi:hypothetical protein